MAEIKKNKKKKQSSQAKASTPTQPTASKRIENLENAVMSIDKNMNLIADEVNRLSQVLQGLAVRINAVISAGETGIINNNSVNDIIIQDNVKQLKSKIDMLVENKVLELGADAIGDKTFVVGRELALKDGETVESNPRVQFSYDSLNDADLKEKLSGAKVGDQINFDQDSDFSTNTSIVSFEVVEIYKVCDPEEKDINFEEEPAE